MSNLLPRFDAASEGRETSGDPTPMKRLPPRAPPPVTQDRSRVDGIDHRGPRSLHADMMNVTLNEEEEKPVQMMDSSGTDDSPQYDGVLREVVPAGNLVGLTPFAMAVMSCDENIIDIFLANMSIEAINYQDAEGNTALHYAMIKHASNPWVVEKLLRAGADVNIFNNAGQKPLTVLMTGQLSARGRE